MKTITTKPRELINFRVKPQLRKQLVSYAKLTGRSQTYITEEALSEYFAWRVPQLEDLKKAIIEADRGKFADEKKVNAILEKYAQD